MADIRFFKPWAAPIFADDAAPSGSAESVPGPENTQVLADKIVQMMSAPSVFAAQPGKPAPAELRSYQPTFTERAGNAMQDGMMALGADPYTAGCMAHGIRDLLGWTPAGIPMAVGDMKSAIDRGDMTGAAINSFGLLPLARPARMAGRTIAEAEMLASRSASLYNPPAKPARLFEQDYPNGAVSDATGKLKADIEGRALGSQFVVGRRTLGGEDVALSPAQFDALSKGTIGTVPETIAAYKMPRGTVGTFTHARGIDGPERSINILNGLAGPVKDKVTAHELGHAIDDLAGLIPTTGLSSELKPLYNTLSTGRERTRNLMGPQHLGYSRDDIPREHIAEAIRAYMADPNYIKTVAPKTAARIREFVNNNPRLNKIIQFNGIAAAPAGLAGSESYQPDSGM